MHMEKYQGLSDFLSDLCEDKIVMSFESVNDLVGGNLPDSAFRHRPWWANRSEGKGSQNLAWQSVGWETRDVNMELDEVTFVRARKHKRKIESLQATGALTIAQAKAGLAANFGISKDSIEIHIKG
ncbi:hypothetical protein PF049_03545 [Erythrobacteraceae bacterium WH01K]|nr:hypothetical protein PF049_03545 [Erythrobacteraceae bacterium WH01K]